MGRDLWMARGRERGCVSIRGEWWERECQERRGEGGTLRSCSLVSSTLASQMMTTDRDRHVKACSIWSPPDKKEDSYDFMSETNMQETLPGLPGALPPNPHRGVTPPTPPWGVCYRLFYHLRFYPAHRYTNGFFSYCYSIHKYSVGRTWLKGMISVIHCKFIETLYYSKSIYATFEYSPYRLLQLLSSSHFRSCAWTSINQQQGKLFLQLLVCLLKFKLHRNY